MSTFGLLADTSSLLTTLSLLALFGTLAFNGARLWMWSLTTLAVLWVWGLSLWFWIPVVPVLLILNLRPLRPHRTCPTRSSEPVHGL